MDHSSRPSHPYFPRDAIIDNYEANNASLGYILGQFIGLIVLLVASGLYVAKRVNSSLRPSELAAMTWFLLCFLLHAFFEGYFVLFHASLAGSQSLFAQLWKEYALSDSRYMTSDPFMLCIESLTVLLWAPLCFAIVISIVDRNRMQHPLRIIMCVGHLFGVALYYGTCFFEYRYRGISHSRPELLYYWVYYLGLNAAWVVVPAVCLVDSVLLTAEVMGQNSEWLCPLRAQILNQSRLWEEQMRSLEDRVRLTGEGLRLTEEKVRLIEEKHHAMDGNAHRVEAECQSC